MLSSSALASRHLSSFLASPRLRTTAFLASPSSLSSTTSATSRARSYSSSIMTSKSTTAAASGSDSRSAKVVKTTPLEEAQAKWIKLKSIDWIDPEGRERKWEAADRTTRKGPVDAVAICAIIHRPSWSGPHVLLISQFRPPCGSSVIEMPAGLVDAEDSKPGEDENAGIVRAAVRELREETGYGEHQSGTKMVIAETSTVMMNDPGLTGANMKLCLFHIQVADDAPDPVAEPEEGEHIERHLVPLKGLYGSLKEFQSQGYHVDARLAHFAIGLEVASGGLGLP
ncbi:hypothetical protein A4X13_0g1044 [Tilletia indica]|uniref:Uncharacterized protein n=1 Tax=Tilletia indica TaxID=43049 RepID=A0A177TE12_9BASI|nr:hypothetical protein A4X13_0g1044 [Tilletia indica]